jgi:hypothetical protein
LLGPLANHLPDDRTQSVRPEPPKANTRPIKQLSHCGNTACGTCAANLGYFVFGDVPDTMMAMGATIIVLSGLYAFYRERIRHRDVAASASGLPPDGL